MERALHVVRPDPIPYENTLDLLAENPVIHYGHRNHPPDLTGETSVPPGYFFVMCKESETKSNFGSPWGSLLWSLVNRFFYPTVLGAIVVWFGEGVANYFSPTAAAKPLGHSLLFALLVVSYAPAAFLQAEEDESRKLHRSLWYLIGCVVEVISIYGVFYNLGLIASSDEPNPAGAYGFFFCLVFVGLIYNGYNYFCTEINRSIFNLLLSFQFTVFTSLGWMISLKWVALSPLDQMLPACMLPVMVGYYAIFAEHISD